MSCPRPMHNNESKERFADAQDEWRFRQAPDLQDQNDTAEASLEILNEGSPERFASNTVMLSTKADHDLNTIFQKDAFSRTQYGRGSMLLDRTSNKGLSPKVAAT